MPDMSLLVQMLALLALIGAFAGVLAGLLGVGGGMCWCLRFSMLSRPLAMTGLA